MRNGWKLTALLGALALGACSMEKKDGDAAAATGATTTATAADSAAISPMAGASAGATTGAMAGDSSQMRLEVDVAARQLRVTKNGQPGATYSVAVGSEKWPTQKGTWQVTQVVWNPEWVPPDESWAEEREPRKSGDPKNPLGRVQLVYDPPRSVHGTNAPESIGKAVSHGSIRMRNEDLETLAREIMEAAGSGRDESFYSRVRANRTEKQIVQLQRPVPIRVH